MHVALEMGDLGDIIAKRMWNVAKEETGQSQTSHTKIVLNNPAYKAILARRIARRNGQSDFPQSSLEQIRNESL